MIDNNHDSIRTSTIIYHFIRRFYAGCKLVISNFSSTLIYLFFLLLWCLLWIFKEEIFHLDDFMLSSSMLNSIYNIILILCFLFSNILILVLLGTPSEFRHSQQALQKCGFVNHIGMAPILITRMPSSITPNASIWEFSCEGIPLDVWENKKIQIETALNISVISIRYSTGKQQILLTAVPAKADLPDQIEWKPQFLSMESFVLQLGQSLLGPVTVNLSHIPHILIGGSTGSGKSVLLKLLLMQCIHKGAKVYIADFKGGVDFPPIWHQKSEICTEEADLFEILTDLVQELQQRKSAFKEAGVPNLDSYNQLCSKHLPRYIFACDEIAELLDRTGRSKDQKESISQIEGKLSIIARQGRAFGIHLILATQRPDANILPGQIKNNLDCRICGRADNVLSQIILDCTDAATIIPKDSRGRFLLYDGTVFQAYWFNESSW